MTFFCFWFMKFDIFWRIMFPIKNMFQLLMSRHIGLTFSCKLKRIAWFDLPQAYFDAGGGVNQGQRSSEQMCPQSRFKNGGDCTECMLWGQLKLWFSNLIYSHLVRHFGSFFPLPFLVLNFWRSAKAWPLNVCLYMPAFSVKCIGCYQTPLLGRLSPPPNNTPSHPSPFLFEIGWGVCGKMFVFLYRQGCILHIILYVWMYVCSFILIFLKVKKKKTTTTMLFGSANKM